MTRRDEAKKLGESIVGRRPRVGDPINRAVVHLTLAFLEHEQRPLRPGAHATIGLLHRSLQSGLWEDVTPDEEALFDRAKELREQRVRECTNYVDSFLIGVCGNCGGDVESHLLERSDPGDA